MRYRYLDDFRRGISVFAIFSHGIAVLGTPPPPPPNVPLLRNRSNMSFNKTAEIKAGQFVKKEEVSKWEIFINHKFNLFSEMLKYDYNYNIDGET